MSIIEKAVNWIIGIANDNTHGYDQGSRWSPDYDCSSLVISAWKQAGVNLTCTYTGNMYANMVNKGFSDITLQVNLATGSGLARGDVLLNVANHTAMYIGNGQICEATGNENGGITGGQTGDQTGREICINSYRNYPWNYVLRYVAEDSGSRETQSGNTTSTDDDTYTVQAGDSLWTIAEKVYGSGAYYTKLMSLNGLTNSNIMVGQVLKIKGNTQSVSQPAQSTSSTNDLPILRKGSKGEPVRALQALLILRGQKLTTYGTDGDFGSETEIALRAYQKLKGLTVDGICGSDDWKTLIEKE